jgi:hypothetical protein
MRNLHFQSRISVQKNIYVLREIFTGSSILQDLNFQIIEILNTIKSFNSLLN